MAEGVITKETDLAMLQFTLGVSAPIAWTLGVFVNDVTPDKNTVFADLEQSTDPDYAPFSVPPEDWTFTEESNAWFGALPVHTFVFAGAVTVFGWLLWADDVSSSRLINCGRFGEALVIPDTGGACQVTITRFRQRGSG
jgi:hypothetical protein